MTTAVIYASDRVAPCLPLRPPRQRPPADVLLLSLRRRRLVTVAGACSSHLPRRRARPQPRPAHRRQRPGDVRRRTRTARGDRPSARVLVTVPGVLGRPPRHRRVRTPRPPRRARRLVREPRPITRVGAKDGGDSTRAQRRVVLVRDAAAVVAASIRRTATTPEAPCPPGRRSGRR